MRKMSGENAHEGDVALGVKLSEGKRGWDRKDSYFVQG